MIIISFEYIYAFDLSMDNTGVAIFDIQGNPIHIMSIKTNPLESYGQRLKLINDKIQDLKIKYPTNTIVIERGFSRFNTSTQAIYRVHGLINFLFWDCEQIYYPPKTVKEAIFKGNATKQQILNEIKKRYPDIKFSTIKVTDKKTKQVRIEENDNESDAFAVGLTYFIKKGIIKWK